MSVARTLRKLVLGETWLLPLGLVAVLAAALVLREALPDVWEHAGGFVVLAGVAVILVLSVSTSARSRR